MSKVKVAISKRKAKLFSILILLILMLTGYFYEFRYWNMSQEDRASMAFDEDISDRLELKKGVDPYGGYDSDTNYYGEYYVARGLGYWVGVDNSSREIAAFHVVTNPNKGDQKFNSYNPENIQDLQRIIVNRSGSEIINQATNFEPDFIECNTEDQVEICDFHEIKGLYMYSGELHVSRGTFPPILKIQGCVHRGEGCEFY